VEGDLAKSSNIAADCFVDLAKSSNIAADCFVEDKISTCGVEQEWNRRQSIAVALVVVQTA